MNKVLKDWTVVEIKAGIYDRQAEITILEQELQKRILAQSTVAVKETKVDNEKVVSNDGSK